MRDGCRRSYCWHISSGRRLPAPSLPASPNLPPSLSLPLSPSLPHSVLLLPTLRPHSTSAEGFTDTETTPNIGRSLYRRLHIHQRRRKVLPTLRPLPSVRRRIPSCLYRYSQHPQRQQNPPPTPKPHSTSAEGFTDTQGTTGTTDAHGRPVHTHEYRMTPTAITVGVIPTIKQRRKEKNKEGRPDSNRPSDHW